MSAGGGDAVSAIGRIRDSGAVMGFVGADPSSIEGAAVQAVGRHFGWGVKPFEGGCDV